jgi:hypothetical protein
MGIFALYFAICLLALIVRGYYRVPSTCIIHETIDKEEKTVKSIIADRIECKCHYTNFLWHQKLLQTNNQTMRNISMENNSNQRRFEPTALVRNANMKNPIFVFFFIVIRL